MHNFTTTMCRDILILASEKMSAVPGGKKTTIEFDAYDFASLNSHQVPRSYLEK